MKWDQEGMDFLSKVDNRLLQIVPHPSFTRLHISTIQYRGPNGKTPCKINQWWTTKWIKSWGKNEYTKNLQSSLKTLQTSWNKELPEVKAAITKNKTKVTMVRRLRHAKYAMVTIPSADT